MVDNEQEASKILHNGQIFIIRLPTAGGSSYLPRFLLLSIIPEFNPESKHRSLGWMPSNKGVQCALLPIAR